MEEIEWFENTAVQLWQGKKVDIDLTVKKINNVVDKIVSNMEAMKDAGIEFPIEYVENALNHLHQALEIRDEYKLADNLYFEWRDITTVKNEVMQNLEKNK